MKICKDTEGYFILDSNNCKVNLSYKGLIDFKFPTIMHLGLANWHSNEKGNIVITPLEILVDDIRHFRAVKYAVLEYLIGEHYESIDT